MSVKLRFKVMLVVQLAVVAMLVLSGCKAKEELSLMERINKQLNDMQTYSCKGTLKRISNKGENVYEILQQSRRSGEYKMELLSPESVSGNYTVFDGKQICQYNPRVGGKVVMEVAEGQTGNQLFLGAFVKNYFQSEGVSIAASKMDEGKCTVLEAVVPGGSKYLVTQKLWVDNETLKPVQLVIYDTEGKERYVLSYSEFEYNVTLEDSVFKIPE